MYYAYVCMYVCAYACVFIYIYMHINSPHLYLYFWTCFNIYMQETSYPDSFGRGSGFGVSGKGMKPETFNREAELFLIRPLQYTAMR